METTVMDVGIARKNREGYADPTMYEALKQVQKAEYGYRPLVYICSPYAGDTETNIEIAREFCATAVARRVIPLAPHLLFPQFMDDHDPVQRQQALFMSRLLLTKCNEVWVFGETISQGMASEIRKAESRNKTIRYFTKDCQEVQASCER